MSPFYYIPMALYAYLALKYAWHVAKIDQSVVSFLLAAFLLPVALLAISSDVDSARYAGFKLLPTLPARQTEWDREQKRMAKERKLADLQVEQLRARTEHRHHLEKRQRELDEIANAEVDRLLENDQ